MSPRTLSLAAIGLLTVLHHDVWWWDDPTLVAGIVPIGLLWHAGLSLAAGLVWWSVTRVAWPVDPWEGEP